MTDERKVQVPNVRDDKGVTGGTMDEEGMGFVFRERVEPE